MEEYAGIERPICSLTARLYLGVTACVRVCVCESACACVCAQGCVCKRVCVFAYLRMYVCVSVCVCVGLVVHPPSVGGILTDPPQPVSVSDKKPINDSQSWLCESSYGVSVSKMLRSQQQRVSPAVLRNK